MSDQDEQAAESWRGSDGSDLLARAVEYLLCEKGRESFAAFESQLENDQSAREALADAVAIVAAIRSERSKKGGWLPRTATLQSRQWPLMALSLAICALVAIGWFRAPLGMQRGRSEQLGLPAELAQRWSELRDQAGEADLEESDLVNVSESSDETPSWILAGLVGLGKGNTESTSNTPEEF